MSSTLNQVYRTKYDQDYMHAFSPYCSEKAVQKVGEISYACSPGLGCHLLQQSPGKDASGTRFSNLNACVKSCKTSIPPTHVLKRSPPVHSLHDSAVSHAVAYN